MIDPGLAVAAASSAMRGLSWLVGPVAPATRARVPDDGCTAAAAPGGSAELTVRVDNGQRAPTPIRLAVGELVGPGGTTWLPATTGTTSWLLRPGEVRTITLQLDVPADLPPGTYRGGLLLTGVQDGTTSLRVVVGP